MNVCLDACFLIGLYDPRDQYHLRALELFSELFDTPGQNMAVIVWPVLYETVSTQLVKNRLNISAMERDLRSLRAAKRLDYLDDSPYRDEALDACFGELGRTPASYRNLSLTDRVLRGVLLDLNTRVDAVLTFNVKDFSDACRKSGKTVLF